VTKPEVLKTTLLRFIKTLPYVWIDAEESKKIELKSSKAALKIMEKSLRMMNSKKKMGAT